MTDLKLTMLLQPIVQEHGLGMVLRSLGEIADAQGGISEQSAGAHTALQTPPKGRGLRSQHRST